MPLGFSAVVVVACYSTANLGDEVRLRRIKEQMVVVAHQHPCVDPLARPPARLRPDLEEESPIVFVNEGGLAPFPLAMTG